MKCLLLPRRNLEFLAIALAIIGLLPSCTYAATLKTVAYAKLPGIPVGQTSIDLYECKRSARALVVYVHGGAWVKGDKANVHSMPDYFAANNVCFASVNYPLQSPDQRPVMGHQLDALVALNSWLSQGKIRSDSFSSISILGHSSGAHLVALLDKRYGWYSDVDNLILMDCASYDLSKKFQDSSLRFQQFLSKLLRLNELPSRSRQDVFRRFSPALLPARARRGGNLNVVFLSGHRPAARASAQSLRESYRLSPGYTVWTLNYPWKHRDFPRKIGTDLDFSRRFMRFLRATARK
jgi:hypothetical protein